jgi:hypothetical protein
MPRFACFAMLALVLQGAPVAADGPPDGTGTYEDLVTLVDEFAAWRDPRGEQPRQIIRDTAGQPIAPVPDYGPEVIAERLAALEALQARLEDMNVAAWPRERQVDWLAVRSRLDQQAFLLRFQRPWARDPGFYVDQMLRVTFTDLPVDGESLPALEARLRAVPVLVSEARDNLDDVAADYADLAIFNLSNSDGVGHGYPYRAEPPAGVLGWYADFRGRAETEQPELLPVIDAAQAAVREFDRWLRDRRPGWTATAGSGKAAFDWYLKHVKLMPWTSDEIVVLGERELDRLWALYALERHRNRKLPELEPAASAEDYQARIDATDARVRAFLRDEKFITVPDDIGVLDTNVPWIVRPGGRNFWEEVQFRDPSPDHVHAVIPGHRFDGVLADRQDHPVRSKLYSGARVEGWATYLEEAVLQAGLFEDLPRVRELIQIFGIFRAARVPADVWLQTGTMNAQEVVDYWLERVPYLDENVARVDAEIYLRRPPGYGIGYTIGMLQMQRLLADRKRQLGDDFDLQAFHDDFMAAGRLPLSLVRWDMTGLDDEVKHFWRREPLPDQGRPVRAVAGSGSGP